MADSLFDEEADLANLRTMMGIKGRNAAVPPPEDFDLELPSLDDLDAFAAKKGISTTAAGPKKKAPTVAGLKRFASISFLS